MRILFLLHRYGVSDGISTALREYCLSLPEEDTFTVATRWILSESPELTVTQVASRKELERMIVEGGFDIIHYQKGSNYDLFNWTVKTLRKHGLNIPIITTVHQKPSYPTLLMSPAEMRFSSKIVFIDKTSLKDPLIDFIPQEKRRMIHTCIAESVFEKTGRLLKEVAKTGSHGRLDEKPVIFGRASVLGKCPKDMIEVFDKIDVPNKHFVIVGVPTTEGWLAEKVKGRKDITLMPMLPFDEWLRVCAGFDVFLYQIPLTSHSSTDNTIAQGMLLENAAVYYGVEPVKERFVNGQNGLVADTPDELALLATKVARDPELRERLGKAARVSTMRDWSITSAVKLYKDLYEEAISEKESGPLKVKVPNSYRIYFLRHCYKPLAKSLMAGSVLERQYRKRHPL